MPTAVGCPGRPGPGPGVAPAARTLCGHEPGRSTSNESRGTLRSYNTDSGATVVAIAPETGLLTAAIAVINGLYPDLAETLL
jgi:hypothetical protein